MSLQPHHQRTALCCFLRLYARGERFCHRHAAELVRPTRLLLSCDPARVALRPEMKDPPFLGADQDHPDVRYELAGALAWSSAAKGIQRRSYSPSPRPTDVTPPSLAVHTASP